MAKRVSAGLLMYRRGPEGLEVFLIHPGGPFWRNKHLGAWSIPKGEPNPGEPLIACARRELVEETGLPAPPEERLLPLGHVVQKAGKEVHAWAFEGDLPAGFVLRSNTMPLAWPPHSGKVIEIPEVDEGAFFPLPLARERINAAQVALLDRLQETLGAR